MFLSDGARRRTPITVSTAPVTQRSPTMSGANTNTRKRRTGATSRATLSEFRKGIGLGKNLAKDQDEKGHRDGRVDDASLARKGDQQTGSKRRGKNVDQVVAEQDGADQSILLLTQRIHQTRATAAIYLHLVHSRTRDRSQRSLRARKKKPKAR